VPAAAPVLRLSEHGAYRRFWLPATVSGFGTAVTTLAVRVLVVERLHGGATQVGILNAARWVPYLLVGVFVGVLVDRSRRRPLLVAADLGRAALLLAVPTLSAADLLTLPVLALLMAGFGLLSPNGDAAARATVPRLVPAPLLAGANARLDQSDAVAQTSGPALAGGIVTLVGAPLAVLVDAVSYLASGLLLRRLPVEEPPRHRPVADRVGTDATEGLRWGYGHPQLRPFALVMHGWFLCSAATGAIVVPYALESLRLSTFGLGVALAAAGLGGLAGSLAAVRLGRRSGAARVVVVCHALAGVAWLVAALASASGLGWVVFGAGQLVLGLGMGAENANSMGYRQAVTPDRLQGRMNATMRSLNRAMIVVGAPVGGALGDLLGYRVVLRGAAVGFLVLALGLGLSRFRDARLDERAVAPG